MANSRTLNWYEQPPNDNLIAQNGWVFNLCHKIKQDGSGPLYNVIWQSGGGPFVAYNLTWQVEYALAWSTFCPGAGSGVQVKVSSPWQPCKPGESYYIDIKGQWQPSDTQPADDWMHVSDINYIYPGTTSCYLVVGINAGSSDSPTWNPIYIATQGLPKHSSAQFQPQEEVAWFLGDPGINKTGTVWSQTKSSIGKTKTNVKNSLLTYEWSTSFEWSSGAWLLMDGPAPVSSASLPAQDEEKSTTAEAIASGPFSIARRGGGTFKDDSASNIVSWLQGIWDKLKFSATLSADKLSISVSWGSAVNGKAVNYCIKTDFNPDTPPTTDAVEAECTKELAGEGIDDPEYS